MSRYPTKQGAATLYISAGAKTATRPTTVRARLALSPHTTRGCVSETKERFGTMKHKYILNDSGVVECDNNPLTPKECVDLLNIKEKQTEALQVSGADQIKRRLQDVIDVGFAFFYGFGVGFPKAPEIEAESVSDCDCCPGYDEDTLYCEYDGDVSLESSDGRALVPPKDCPLRDTPQARVVYLNPDRKGVSDV